MRWSAGSATRSRRCAGGASSCSTTPPTRRNAVHALGCVACKPEAELALPDDLTERVARMAADDPSPKVRLEAAHALECRRRATQAVAAAGDRAP